jgi:hypothetical protein
LVSHIRLLRIFRPEGDKLTREWRKLHNEGLHNLYSPPNIIRKIRSRKMRWAGHVAHTGEERKVYKVLVGMPEGRRSFGRPRHSWKDGIRIILGRLADRWWSRVSWLRIYTGGRLS